MDIVDTVKEARGAITAHSGSTNEHFTNGFLNNYYATLEKHLKNGDPVKVAHKKALKVLHKKEYDNTIVKQIADLLVAQKVLGNDEMKNIHEDSKKTASGVADHIIEKYSSHVISSVHVGKSGPKVVEKITGLPSQADIVVETDHTNQASNYIKHKGLSLKYSKAKGTSVKIHSPTINKMGVIIEDHYKMIYGRKFGLHDQLNEFSKLFLQEQQLVLMPYHHILDKFFRDMGDPLKTYTKLVDSDGMHVGGDLSRAATSHIRDSDSKELRAIYDAMSVKNLEMKRCMASSMFECLSAVIDYAPSEEMKTKESLVRSIANIQAPEELTQLPTMIISTDRDKGVHIFDVNNYLENYIKLNGVETCSYTEGTSGFKVGPLTVSLDTRPTTNRNPITSYPINVTMSGAALKKDSG